MDRSIPLRVLAKETCDTCARLALHAAPVLLLVVIIEIFKLLLDWFGHPRFFDVIPVDYVLDAGDLVILVVFVVAAVVQATSGSKDEQRRRDEALEARHGIAPDAS